MPVPAAWRDYYLREWTAFILLRCVLVSAVFAWSGRTSPDVAATAEYAFFGSLLGLAIALVRLAAFRCPRCGRVYSVRLGAWPHGYRKPSSRHCLNCWLPKWADPERVPSEVIDESDDW